MASKNGRRDKSKRRSNNKFKGFINVDFNDKERHEITEWVSESVMEPYDAILSIAERGYKVSISYSSHRDVWHFSLTAKDTHTDYDGYCIVVPHRNLDKVVMVGLYVVDIWLQNGKVEIPGDRDVLDW